MEPLMNHPIRRLAVITALGAVLLAVPRHAYAQG